MASKPNDERPENLPPDPLFLVEKIINIFGWTVCVFLLLVVALTLAYVLLPLVAPSEVSQAIQPEVQTQLSTIYQQLQPLIQSVWAFLRPVLQFVVVIVLLKWLLFSTKGAFANRLGKMLADVPSLIAVFVIAVICLLPLIGVGIPDVLGNIALVIVGFYFGGERQRREREKAGKVDESDNDEA